MNETLIFFKIFFLLFNLWIFGWPKHLWNISFNIVWNYEEVINDLHVLKSYPWDEFFE